MAVTDAPTLKKRERINSKKTIDKHAVKRNRVKRQVREGYRLNKKAIETLVTEHLKPNSQLLIAFIWIDDKLHPSKEVHMKVRSLMEHIAERVIKRETLKAEQP